MAWLKASVILVTFLGPSCAFQVAENVVFEQTRETSVVRSKLIFSFFVDLKSYRQHLEKIQGNLVLTQMNLGQVIIERRKRNRTHYLPKYVPKTNDRNKVPKRIYEGRQTGFKGHTHYTKVTNAEGEESSPTNSRQGTLVALWNSDKGRTTPDYEEHKNSSRQPGTNCTCVR